MSNFKDDDVKNIPKFESYNFSNEDVEKCDKHFLDNKYKNANANDSDDKSSS